MFYARQNDSARAIEFLQKAVSIRPDYADALRIISASFTSAPERNREAEVQFRKCIEVAPNFDQAYLNLAQLYMLANEKEEARAVLRTLLKLQPQHRLALQALEMLN